MGATKAVKRLKKKASSLREKIRLQEIKISELTGRRDQLINGLGFIQVFKSTKRRVLEDSVDALREIINTNDHIIRSLETEIVQLEIQHSVQNFQSTVEADLQQVEAEIEQAEAEDIPEETQAEIAQEATTKKFIYMTIGIGIALFIGSKLLK